MAGKHLFTAKSKVLSIRSLGLGFTMVESKNVSVHPLNLCVFSS